MEEKLVFRYIFATCCISLLSACIAAHCCWVYSTRGNATVVSTSPRIDASQRMGIQTINLSNPRIIFDEKDLKNLTIIWSDRTMNLMQVLTYEEGFRPTPYLCSMGYVTVGLGTKLYNIAGADPHDFPLRVTRVQAEFWLNEEVELKEHRIMAKPYFGEIFERLNGDRKVIILSMAYQMGVTRLTKFKNMWAALDRGDWEEAQAQALDSRWAKQTPRRALRHARVLGGEKLAVVYEEL